MRRRDFVGLTGAAAVLGPLAAHAQQPKMPIVGVLVVGAPSSGRFRRIFREAMRKLGYVEGRNIRFEYRSDHGHAARLPKLAAELVRLGANVIVAWFTPAASAAKQATHEIPIVMAAAGDPVATGLVESLARPGGNVTGISGMSADLAGKCVGLMRQMLPSARRMAALANAPDPFSKPFLAKIRLAGEAMGIAIDPILIQSPDQLDAAFSAMAAARPEALIVQSSLPIQHVAELALKHRVPSAAPSRPFAEDGGLMSYWFDEVYTYRRAAVFVDKILKGAKPADLPVEQPTRFWLVINLKTAKALGLTVPKLLLAQADELIE
jgi:putative tryptophan/tyrosine transport system substrate-binding protein